MPVSMSVCLSNIIELQKLKKNNISYISMGIEMKMRDINEFNWISYEMEIADGFAYYLLKENSIKYFSFFVFLTNI